MEILEEYASLSGIMPIIVKTLSESGQELWVPGKIYGTTQKDGKRKYLVGIDSKEGSYALEGDKILPSDLVTLAAIRFPELANGWRFNEKGEKIVPQIQFDTLKDFIAGMNNFHNHFLDDCEFGKEMRERAYFKRFQNKYPELETELTKETVRVRRSQEGAEYLFEKLFSAYKLMSQLVYINDPWLLRAGGELDKKYLTR